MSLPIFQQPAFPHRDHPREEPIQYLSHGKTSALGCLVRLIHSGWGCFLSYILRENFTNALAAAGRLSYSCQFWDSPLMEDGKKWL